MADRYNLTLLSNELRTKNQELSVVHSFRLGDSFSNSAFPVLQSTVLLATHVTKTGNDYGIEFNNYTKNAESESAGINYIFRTASNNTTSKLKFLEVSSLTNNPVVKLQGNYLKGDQIQGGQIFTNGLIASNSVQGPVLSSVQLYVRDIIATNLFVSSISANSLNTKGMTSDFIQTSEILTGAAGTPSMTMGSSGIDVGNWLMYYLVDSPPAPTSNLSGYSSNSVETMISWIPPPVSSLGFTNVAIPAMTKLNVTIEDSNASRSYTISDSNYMPAYTTSPLQHLVIRKNNSANLSSRYETRNLTSTAYVIYPPVGTTITSPFSVKLSYGNFNSNAALKQLLLTTGFSSGTIIPPAPTSVLITNVTSNSATITTTSPSVEPGNPAIVSFNLSYAPNKNVTPRRYGGNFIAATITRTGVGETDLLSNLTPDTAYTVSTIAVDDQGTKSSEYRQSFTTSSFAYSPTTLNTINLSNLFPSNAIYKAGTLYKNGSPVTNNVFFANPNLILSNFTIAVHNSNVRGTDQANLMHLNGSLNAEAPSSFFRTNGFPASSSSTSNQGSIRFTPEMPTDIFSNTAQGGFYLQQNVNWFLVTTASSNTQTLSLSQTIYDGTNPMTYTTSNYTFYVDNLDKTLSPTLSNFSVSVITAPKNVCGLRVYPNTLDIATSNISFSGMSSNFSPSGIITAVVCNATSDISATATLLDKASSPIISPLLNGTSVTATFTLSNSYIHSPIFKTTIKNTNYLTNSSNATLNILVDNASYQNTLSRMQTPLNFTDTRFRTTFNNEELPSGELLLSQGNFVPAGNAAYTSYSYHLTSAGTTQSYGSINNSLTARFGSVFPYQYATFRFEIAPNFNTTKFDLVLSGLGGSLATSAVPTGGTYGRVTMDGSLIQVFYKVEPQNGTTSTWIDGNSDINYSYLGTSWYSDLTRAGTFGGLAQAPIISGTTQVTLTNTTATLTSSSGGYIYVIIGISKSKENGFQNVTLTLKP